MGQHFIEAGSAIALVLDAVLSAAGSNFSAPFDSATQPHDVASANNETLIQYQTPGGAQIEGHANPGSGGSIGTAINSMLGLLSPVISAYALILPILGVIRGIIEILCCLMNPFCVIGAIIRLFAKWIPPFISLFPPLAGIIIILSTIKAILAIVFFIMTELIPFIELMIANIRNLVNLFANPDNLNDSQKESAIAKLTSLLETLIQKSGILVVFKPLLDLIFLILKLVAGFPCSGGNTKKTNSSTGNVGQVIQTPETPAQAASTASVPIINFDPDIDDSSCCPCSPDVITDRDKTPRGSGVLVVSGFGDCAPKFVFSLRTGNPKVRELEQFQESAEEQLNCQLDEPIKYSRPVGSTGDRSLLKVKLSDRRGVSRSVEVPVLDVKGTTIKVSSPLAFLFLGRLINYEVRPDYDMLVHQGVIGIGCHPDVKDVKNKLSDQFPNLGESALDSNPEAESLQDDYDKLVDDMDRIFDNIGNALDIFEDLMDDAFESPPVDEEELRELEEDVDDKVISLLRDIEEEAIDLLSGFAADLTNRFDTIAARNISSIASTFDVDKRTVRADDTDIATITVVPRDITGSLLLKNPPSGISDGVEILTDFGTVFDQRLDGPTGTVIAKIKSSVIGRAVISVKVNNELIVDSDGVDDPVVRTKAVNFVAEDILPTRRRRTKSSGKAAVNIGITPEREPGNR
jgi:hypothetical protein